jgi:hypothetical protein
MRGPTAAILAACLASLCAGAAQRVPAASPRVLRPVDEGPRDPSLVAFRTRLLRAVRAHDRTYLLTAIDPNIATTFGREDSGKAAFERIWKLNDDPDRSDLWSVLESVLTLGGTFMGSTKFWAPYVYTKFPSDLSAFDHGVVLRSNAPVFAAPSANSGTLTSVSFEILRMELPSAPEPSPEAGWVQVRLGQGQRGYMRRTDIRSPVDYRAGFVKRGGTWTMTVLVAGD